MSIPDEPGAELDLHIAKEVLGWELKSTGASSWSLQVDGAEANCWRDPAGNRMFGEDFRPSRCDGHALEVLKHFAAKGVPVELISSNLKGRWRVRVGNMRIPQGAPTIAMAICRAVLERMPS